VSELPTPEETHVQAQLALLDGLRCGEKLSQLERAVRRCQTTTFTPDIALLDVGVAALDLAGVDRNAPLAKTELIGRHLPEINFRNQRALQERTTYALNAIASAVAWSPTSSMTRSGGTPGTSSSTPSSPPRPTSEPAHNVGSRRWNRLSTIFMPGSNDSRSSRRDALPRKQVLHRSSRL